MAIDCLTVSASKFIDVSLIGTFVLSTYLESVAKVGELRGSVLNKSCEHTDDEQLTKDQRWHK
eukprot:SAG31_NODE_45769_length_257_cov_0.974684_1_plen_62_part_10